MFQSRFGRFATVGVISSLPGEVIDSFWHIIDRNLQGVIPLENLLHFELKPKDGKLTITFYEDNVDLKMTFDQPLPWNEDYPNKILAYDDGTSQTILLPSEAN
ncbi:DUF960 domain-containing protein [Lactobacillus sp. CC-MHH1034]|uniref:DUF960 domain-containing protein n=1 Tax=Agrilactobacillus fermenti TaxID=2586909 RepID=UPI001E5EE655|nr:DUF960 domain-containing protein [Agrilactobacillus fermenti]MCD2255789.1 DUF960 domain-containing protein [Agrilactobacillus fermenti]